MILHVFCAYMATVYFAKWTLLPNGELLHNGGVVADGDIISAVGPRGKLKHSSRDRTVNLGDALLMPGLINMHTHLEEGVLRGHQKGDDESFVSWFTRRRADLQQTPADSILSSARLCIRECLANGITTVVDSTATDIPTLVLRDEPIRSWVFHETHPEGICDTESTIAHLKKRIERSHRLENIGISPYAPYSLVPKQQKALIEMARDNHYLWASHIAESSEELQAFAVQAGELYTAITAHAEWPYRASEQGSMYYALTNNLIPHHGICFHCNYMSGQDLSLLTAKNASVVFCCQYNAMLDHKSFPLDVAHNRGINICLGTEAPCGTRPMNLFDDLYLIKTMYPHISAQQLVDMVTRNPARALRNNRIGALEEGRKADVIALRFSHDPQADILEEMIMAEPSVVLVVVDGEEVIAGY